MVRGVRTHPNTKAGHLYKPGSAQRNQSRSRPTAGRRKDGTGGQAKQRRREPEGDQAGGTAGGEATADGTDNRLSGERATATTDSAGPNQPEGKGPERTTEQPGTGAERNRRGKAKRRRPQKRNGERGKPSRPRERRRERRNGTGRHQKKRQKKGKGEAPGRAPFLSSNTNERAPAPPDLDVHVGIQTIRRR